jgi:hypothetical protein
MVSHDHVYNRQHRRSTRTRPAPGANKYANRYTRPTNTRESHLVGLTYLGVGLIVMTVEYASVNSKLRRGFYSDTFSPFWFTHLLTWPTSAIHREWRGYPTLWDASRFRRLLNGALVPVVANIVIQALLAAVITLLIVRAAAGPGTCRNRPDQPIAHSRDRARSGKSAWRLACRACTPGRWPDVPAKWGLRRPGVQGTNSVVRVCISKRSTPQRRGQRHLDRDEPVCLGGATGVVHRDGDGHAGRGLIGDSCDG